MFTFILCFLISTSLYAHHPGSSHAAQGVEFESISSAAMINSPTVSTLGEHHIYAGFAFEHTRYNSIPAATSFEYFLNGEGAQDEKAGDTFRYNLAVFFAFPIPIYQNLGGEHEEKKFELIAGSGFSF